MKLECINVWGGQEQWLIISQAPRIRMNTPEPWASPRKVALQVFRKHLSLIHTTGRAFPMRLCMASISASAELTTTTIFNMDTSCTSSTITIVRNSSRWETLTTCPSSFSSRALCQTSPRAAIWLARISGEI